ncbi:glycosyltransferase [Trichocoleus sp. FACHB-591]|uniref:glycosyltransferase n=1 Tax=Trichocoleus sp. FACHB-591 TaxID=2692872 RepID=UPI0016863907|nr:glycosyltransferase [Trichocoleus sp. FACHB-591]
MKILISLPVEHPEFSSIDDLINGTASCSGTIGSIVRLAYSLSSSGYQIYLSAASKTRSKILSCIQHHFVEGTEFDYLIVHQSHWDGFQLSFRNHNLPKTIIWLQNQTSWSFVHSFLEKGGRQVVVPSRYHANIYRALSGWRNKVVVIHNSYCSTFTPTVQDRQPILLFIGAITPNKGFIELMQLWLYLVQKQVDLQLAIAGSISLHKGSSVKTGALNVAEADFEHNYVEPWFKALPSSYKPHFLGALPPNQLCTEISRSWAVIVNPSWACAETFCVSAVDAQACDRTVFSVAVGGLKETVYQGAFQSLSQKHNINVLGDCIIKGLFSKELVENNSRLAGEFVRTRFSTQTISKSWIQLLSGEIPEENLHKRWETPRDLACDLMRFTRTGMLIKKYLSS